MNKMPSTGRRSRTEIAKSVIELWRRLWKHPDAPRIRGNFYTLHAEIGEGLVRNSLGRWTATLHTIGLLTRERDYSERLTYFFELKGSEEDGAKAIAKYFAKGGVLTDWESRKIDKTPTVSRSQEAAGITPRVAIRENEAGEPVEAVVGPDAPNPFSALRELRRDEPAALVEAARQYAHRQDFVIERLTEIEKLGVEIDREKVMKAIKLQRNDEFEGIVLVLPYIDELEGRLNQAQGWRDQMLSAREELKLARIEKQRVESELNSQKEANKRMAERHVREMTSQPTVLVGNR